MRMGDDMELVLWLVRVSVTVFSWPWGHALTGLTTAAFFAIIDLLAILPYYIEIALQADTVRTGCAFVGVVADIGRAVRVLQVQHSCVARNMTRTSALTLTIVVRTFRLLRVFRPFRYSNTLLLWVDYHLHGG